MYIGTKIEEIIGELVIKLSVWKKKNKVDIGDLPWIERRIYFIREKAILLLINEVIDYRYFIVPLFLY